MKRWQQILLFFILVIAICFIVTSRYENPLLAAEITILCTTALTYIFNLTTKEYSWTDRLWSTLPIYLAWLYYFKTKESVLLITAILITLWGARLTFNFSRRGGFSQAEDYRWSILQKKLGKGFVWQLFSLLFIAFYQQALFVGFTLPLSLVNASANTGTYIFAILALLLIVWETISDQQQWNFQESKHGRIPKKPKFDKEYERGFRTSGLYKISRHPNYFGELGFWWAIYFLCAVTIGEIINLSLIGPVLLSLLFVGSVKFTENISKEKYKEYKSYQKKVSAVIPIVWKKFK